MSDYYFQYDKETKIVNHKKVSAFNGSKIPQIPRNALVIEPLPKKKCFVVVACDFDETGRPHSTKYLEDHRGKTIYSKTDSTQFEEVQELGQVKEGFTLSGPLTIFDEWIGNQWVTNQSNKYIADFNQVDDTRRRLYSTMCDPLMAEAHIKRALGFQSEASNYESQAFAARERIQKENPWPELLI